MSAEDLDNYETDAELALYKEYRDVIKLFTYVVETERRFYLANKVDFNVRSAGQDVYFDVRLTDAWVWDVYRSSRFVKTCVSSRSRMSMLRKCRKPILTFLIPSSCAVAGHAVASCAVAGRVVGLRNVVARFGRAAGSCIGRFDDCVLRDAIAVYPADLA